MQSQLAYATVLDLFTGKITLAMAAADLYTLALGSIAAALSILSVALIAFGAVWMVYESTAGSARRNRLTLPMKQKRAGLD